MEVKKIDVVVTEYLGDLFNLASQFDFQPYEIWQLDLVTDAEKSFIEKKYYPTVAKEVVPESLIELLGSVKSGLKQIKSAMENSLAATDIQRNHFHYLIAFNPKRERTGGSEYRS